MHVSLTGEGLIPLAHCLVRMAEKRLMPSCVPPSSSVEWVEEPPRPLDPAL